MKRQYGLMWGSVVLPLILIAVLCSACGGSSSPPAEESATVVGNVPYEIRPVPEGDVVVQIFPATAELDPVATLVTSDGSFTFDVPPGTYVVRASYYDSMRQSQPIQVAAGELGEARFARQ